MNSIQFRHVHTNGITLHIAEAGPKKGPLVILLHGFPDFCYGWRRQIPYLADLGFHVLAPDQRGYNLSSKPKRVADYALPILAQDILGLADSVGASKFSVVGHDWGGGVAWTLAKLHPKRVDKLAVLNMPHLAVTQKALLTSLRQNLRSWYAYLFQIPVLSETIVGLGQGFFLQRSMQSSSRPGTFSEADFAEYRKAWAQKDALRSMLNWYRSAFRNLTFGRRKAGISPPTLLLWGKKDAFLGSELAKPSLDYCQNGRLVFFEDAGHWLQHEEPERVNRELGQFLIAKEK